MHPQAVGGWVWPVATGLTEATLTQSATAISRAQLLAFCVLIVSLGE